MSIRTRELLFIQNVQCSVEPTSVSFGRNLKTFKHFLGFSTDVPASSCRSLSQTWHQLFLGGGAPRREMVFRNQNPGAGRAQCNRGITARSVFAGLFVDAAAVISWLVVVVP